MTRKIDRDWLRKRIENDPDLPVEAGVAQDARSKATPGPWAHHLQCENERLQASKEALRSLLNSLQMCEQEYRQFHDQRGPAAIETGRAWDRMRRCGDEARAALAQGDAS